MHHAIKHRFTGSILYEGEAETLGDLVATAVRGGADLGGAYLKGADLRGADLRGADLKDANLRDADLRGANLGGADLRDADLGGAYLGGAYLGGADLGGADLGGAYLGGAYLNWQSHDLMAEILRSAAGEDVEKRMIAGLVLISRDWCWDELLSLEIDASLREWALCTLAEAASENDMGVPAAIREHMTASAEAQNA